MPSMPARGQGEENKQVENKGGTRVVKNTFLEWTEEEEAAEDQKQELQDTLERKGRDGKGKE